MSDYSGLDSYQVFTPEFLSALDAYVQKEKTIKFNEAMSVFSSLTSLSDELTQLKAGLSSVLNLGIIQGQNFNTIVCPPAYHSEHLSDVLLGQTKAAGVARLFCINTSLQSPAKDRQLARKEFNTLFDYSDEVVVSDYDRSTYYNKANRVAQLYRCAQLYSPENLELVVSADAVQEETNTKYPRKIRFDYRGSRPDTASVKITFPFTRKDLGISYSLAEFSIFKTGVDVVKEKLEEILRSHRCKVVFEEKQQRFIEDTFLTPMAEKVCEIGQAVDTFLEKLQSQENGNGVRSEGIYNLRSCFDTDTQDISAPPIFDKAACFLKRFRPTDFFGISVYRVSTRQVGTLPTTEEAFSIYEASDSVITLYRMRNKECYLLQVRGVFDFYIYPGEEIQTKIDYVNTHTENVSWVYCENLFKHLLNGLVTYGELLPVFTEGYLKKIEDQATQDEED